MGGLLDGQGLFQTHLGLRLGGELLAGLRPDTPAGGLRDWAEASLRLAYFQTEGRGTLDRLRSWHRHVRLVVGLRPVSDTLDKGWLACWAWGRPVSDKLVGWPAGGLLVGLGLSLVSDTSDSPRSTLAAKALQSQLDGRTFGSNRFLTASPSVPKRQLLLRRQVHGVNPCRWELCLLQSFQWLPPMA